MTININKLRRLAQAATPGPDGVSLSWVKLLQDFQKGANPATISELLDRLEEAESDALEQARLNGVGASREAALMAKLEAAEKERDDVAQQLVQSEQGKRKISEECDALRARIEAMERQEPVARFNWSKGKLEWLRPWDYSTMNMKSLYLAPGAQGEEK